jgi:hypothetical protein
MAVSWSEKSSPTIYFMSSPYDGAGLNPIVLVPQVGDRDRTFPILCDNMVQSLRRVWEGKDYGPRSG